MTDERLALLVRAAMRGFMEAVLAVDVGEEQPGPSLSKSGPVAQPEELAFPSVTNMETAFTEEQKADLAAWNAPFPDPFGMAPPQGNADLDAAVTALARARAQQEQDARPAVQGGPGEKEVAEWLRIPQA